jgi:hypothetical protein
MVLVDVGVHPEHVQTISSNIGPELVENVEMFKMSQFEPISGKKLRVIARGPFFKTPLYFIEAEDRIFKTLYKTYTINILENMSISIFLYFSKYKILELGPYF